MARRNFSLMVLQALDRNLQNLAAFVHRQTQSAANQAHPEVRPAPVVRETGNPGGPPAHWLERVRQGQAASQFLESGLLPGMPATEDAAFPHKDNPIPESRPLSGPEPLAGTRPARPAYVTRPGLENSGNRPARVRFALRGNPAAAIRRWPPGSNSPEEAAAKPFEAGPLEIEKAPLTPEDLPAKPDSSEERVREPIKDDLSSKIAKQAETEEKIAGKQVRFEAGMFEAENPEGEKHRFNRAEPASNLPQLDSTSPESAGKPVINKITGQASSQPEVRSAGFPPGEVNRKASPVSETEREPWANPTAPIRENRLEVKPAGLKDRLKPPTIPNWPPDDRIFEAARGITGPPDRPVVSATTNNHPGPALMGQPADDHSTVPDNRPWPELPEESFPENEEWPGTWRKLEHLARLEREQRGVYGTGRLFD
jgi:hypothetical protein